MKNKQAIMLKVNEASEASNDLVTLWPSADQNKRIYTT